MSKRRLVVFLGIAVSGIFLWIALRGTDFAEIGRSLQRANFWYLVPLLASYGVFYWIKAMRWRLLLAPMIETTTRRLISPMMIGFMGNNVLPAHLGEFVRMYLGAKRLGLSKALVLATIVLERMFDFLSVVLFLSLVLVFGRDVPEQLVTIGRVTALISLTAIVGAAIYVAWTQRFLRFLAWALAWAPERLRGALLHQLAAGALGLHALRRPRLLIGIVLTSALQWAFMGVATFLAVEAVGITVPISAGFVVLAAITFGVTLPTAPGFLGTIQACYALALAPYAVGKSAAVSASAFFHVPTYLSVTLLGLWLLKRTGGRLRDLSADEDAPDPPDRRREEDSPDDEPALAARSQ